MQYSRPGGNHFAGDCMPFFHEGRFHLFYLLDEDHHQGRDGLGGHQWAHVSTRDLVHWEHHPLAIPLTEDREGSICTGSVIFHNGSYHAFYATRLRDYTQHLSHAVSADGIDFEKTLPNPFSSPPEGYSPVDYRDPCVFRDEDGRFQMLVTSKLTEYPLFDRGGCLLRLSSSDLKDWRVEGPLLIPGGDAGYACVPECPDYFVWNGWHYLVFGLGLKTHYRMGRTLLGARQCPPQDFLGNGLLAVMKSAPFGDGRRIGVGWIGCRRDGKDAGGILWGGNLVFRELIQHPDGTLGTRFVPEMVPATGPALRPVLEALTPGASGDPSAVRLNAPQTLEAAALHGLPRNYRLRCRVRPTARTAQFGLGLRGAGRFETFYGLTFDASERTVSLAGERLAAMEGLDDPMELDVVLTEDIIDVCVDQRQCIVNRLGERDGDSLFLFCRAGSVQFDGIDVAPLL